MKKVSVIVPFYKVEDYVAECAESLMAQTYADIEFVFVNDGSPDSSREKLEEVLSRHPGRDSRIIDKPNGGLPQARKTGVDACSGDYVLNVDSDDWLETDAVEKLVAAAEKENADVVYFYAWKEFADGRRRVITDRAYATPQEFADEIYAHNAHASVCLKFWRRALYEPEIFFPRFGIHEDMVQSVQLLDRASKAVLLPEPLYHYRRTNSGAMTKKSRRSRRKQSLRNYLDLYLFYKDSLDTSPIRRLWRKMLRKARWWGLVWDCSVFKEYPFL